MCGSGSRPVAHRRFWYQHLQTAQAASSTVTPQPYHIADRLRANLSQAWAPPGSLKCGGPQRPQGALQQGTCSRAASASRASCAACSAETVPLPQRSRAATLPCASWSLPWSSSRASSSWRSCPAAAATSAVRRSLAARLAASCSCNAASVVLRSSSACSRRNSADGRECVRLHHQQGAPLRVTSQPCMDCPPGFLVYDKL